MELTRASTASRHASVAPASLPASSEVAGIPVGVTIRSEDGGQRTGRPVLSRAELTEAVKRRARELGFELVGVARATPAETADAFRDWIAADQHGEMGYMAREPERRIDPRRVLPNAVSIVVVGLNYKPPTEGGGRKADGGRGNSGGLASWGSAFRPPPSALPVGQIARYARGDDYHDVVGAKLAELLAFVRAEVGDEAAGKAYVDAGPLLERDLAARAGLGWFGKNTMLLHRTLGSYFFLGALLLALDLDPDAPTTAHCGSCTRCLTGCPTGAFVAPYVLDARRCLSYLTIELKGSIPRELRPLIGDWIFGCDICQEVCPWNRKAPAGVEPALRSRGGLDAPELIPLLAMTDEEFRVRFKGHPIKRAKRRGLLRNVAVALGNSGDGRAIPALAAALRDYEPLVRGHAAWALGELAGEEARRALAAALETETDEWVREEIRFALRNRSFLSARRGVP
jgi:epoxyqueuosine reductase